MMTHARYLLIALIVFALAACGGGGGGESASAPTEDQAAGDAAGGETEAAPEETEETVPANLQAPPDTGTIRVASLPIPHNIQFIELARFAEPYGLDVEWVSFQRYADTQLAVSQGDVEFAAAGYHTAALDTAPTNVDIVAGGNSGAQALVIREGVEVSTWEDLAGLRIGVAPNSGPDIQFRLAAATAGFDPNQIERVNFTTIGPPTLVAMANEEIDGMLCWELWCAQAVVDGQGYYAPLDIGENPTENANTLMLGNEEWLTEHPEAATLLVKAYVDAVEHFRSNPDEWVQAVQAATGASNPEVLQTALDQIELEWELFSDRAIATAEAYAEFGVSAADMSEQVEGELMNYQYLTEATGMSVSEVGG